MSHTDFSFVMKNFFGKDREVHVRVEPMREKGSYAYEHGRGAKAERRSHGRAYIWGEPDPEDSSGLTRPEYGPRGVDAEADRAWDAYNAEEKRIMRLVLDRVFAEGAKRGFKVDSMTYNKYAGCASCPCSPGFILKGLRAEVRINLREVGGLWQGFNGKYDGATPYEGIEASHEVA